MAARRQPKQLRAKRTRRHLLEAARRVFAEKGYAGATVDDVAEAAGCSKGAYYFHFASKEEALLALLDDWARARNRLLSRAAGQRPPADRLRALVAALLSLDPAASTERRLLVEFWAQGERNPRVGERLAELSRSWAALLAGAFARAAEAGVAADGLEPDAAAALCLALHDGLVAGATLRGPADGQAAVVESALALLVARESLRAAG